MRFAVGNLFVWLHQQRILSNPQCKPLVTFILFPLNALQRENSSTKNNPTNRNEANIVTFQHELSLGFVAQESRTVDIVVQ